MFNFILFCASCYWFYLAIVTANSMESAVYMILGVVLMIAMEQNDN